MSGRPDSNRRRPAWEAGILPTELRPQLLALASFPIYPAVTPTRYGRRTGATGVAAGTANDAFSPPCALHVASDGVPDRNAPSLHCIVAPAGGRGSTAGASCAFAADIDDTGAGGGAIAAVVSNGALGTAVAAMGATLAGAALDAFIGCATAAVAGSERAGTLRGRTVLGGGVCTTNG